MASPLFRTHIVNLAGCRTGSRETVGRKMAVWKDKEKIRLHKTVIYTVFYRYFLLQLTTKRWVIISWFIKTITALVTIHVVKVMSVYHPVPVHPQVITTKITIQIKVLIPSQMNTCAIVQSIDTQYLSTIKHLQCCPPVSANVSLPIYLVILRNHSNADHK